MNSLNQIILEGNVTRDPELKEMQNGGRAITLPIAVNRTYKSKDGQNVSEVSYFDIDAYGNLAEACAKWCPKGRGVRVVGRIKQERWTDQEGKNRSKVKVIAEHIEFKPIYKKEGDTTAKEKSGPDDAYAGNPDPAKKEKIVMLAKAAAEVQTEGAPAEGEAEATF